MPQWYVLRTKPRQELRAQLNLEAWGLETLLPILPERRRRPRLHAMVRALFPSYIFCRFPDTYFDKVRFTYGVAYVLSFGGRPAVVEQSLIDGLREHMDEHGTVLLARGTDLRDWNNPRATQARELYRAGDQVVIQSGPFQNLVGVFEQDMPGSERVRILLDTVQFRTRLVLPRFEVSRVQPSV